MRQIILVFLLFVVAVQPVRAYNVTEMAQMTALAGIHLTTALMSDHEYVSGAKFGLQFAAGIYHPASEALILGLRHVYLGDKMALGSGLNMANRAVAKTFAGYFNSTETKGYWVAAGMDLGALLVLEYWDQIDACNTIQDWTFPGALVNAFYQGMLVRGNIPEMAGVLTSVMTGVVAVMPIHEKFQTTFMAETGFRLLPSITSMVVSNAEIKSLINCAGMFLILKSNQMREGHLRTFTGSTSVSFLISAVIDMVERFKKGMDEVWR